MKMNNYVNRPLTFWETYNDIKQYSCHIQGSTLDFRNTLAASNGGIISYTNVKVVALFNNELLNKYLSVLDAIYNEKLKNSLVSYYLYNGNLDTIVTYYKNVKQNVVEFSIFTKDLELIEPFIKILKENAWKPFYKLTKITGFNNDKRPTREDVDFNSATANIGLDCFYPFIEKGVDSFINDFMNSKQNILVLLGLPGTGKSSFIRHFLKEPNKVNLITNSHVLEDPSLPKTFRDDGTATNMEGNKINQVTIYEDADTFILPRDNGNKQLSALLNHVEGIVPTSEKFIITANITNTDKIDAALLRPGRCYKVLFFDKLTPEQANIARVAIGKTFVENLRDRLTLSEALNYEFIEELVVHKKAHIGF